MDGRWADGKGLENRWKRKRENLDGWSELYPVGEWWNTEESAGAIVTAITCDMGERSLERLSCILC